MRGAIQNRISSVSKSIIDAAYHGFLPAFADAMISCRELEQMLIFTKKGVDSMCLCAAYKEAIFIIRDLVALRLSECTNQFLVQ
jgi:hypothetical protein